MHWSVSGALVMHWCIGVFGDSPSVSLVSSPPALPVPPAGGQPAFHVLANGERARVSEIEKNAKEKEKEPGADTLHPPPPPPLLPAAALPAPGFCLKT